MFHCNVGDQVNVVQMQGSEICKPYGVGLSSDATRKRSETNRAWIKFRRFGDLVEDQVAKRSEQGMKQSGIPKKLDHKPISPETQKLYSLGNWVNRVESD